MVCGRLRGRRYGQERTKEDNVTERRPYIVKIESTSPRTRKSKETERT